MHSFIALAYQAIKTYLETEQLLPAPDPLPANMVEPAAVFVTLYAADNQLRGCRGTLVPTEPNLAEAIIRTAVSSAINDPRFTPITLAEVTELKIKVDILSALEHVSDVNLLDEKVYGVLIQSDSRRAVLLPNIDVVKNVPHQLELVRRKAGLSPNEPADLYRFTVTRYEADS